jgi:hypothetical protein
MIDATPKFASPTSFDDATYKAEDRMKSMKLWSDTMSLVLQNLVKITKKFMSLLEKENTMNSYNIGILI